MFGRREPFDESRRSLWYVFFREVRYPLLLVVVSSFLFLLVLSFASDKSVVKKAPFIADLSTAIANGADLAAVRHIYRKRRVERSNLFTILGRPSPESVGFGEYYSSDTPLSDILQDIRIAQFIAKPQGESHLLPNLDKIIKEHLQTNPFDKLELGQREAFDSIRAKLGANYENVQLEITRVSDELYSKNLAVEKYLRDSTFNLWLSVLALFISLVISAYQLFQGREKRMLDLFVKATAALTARQRG